MPIVTIQAPSGESFQIEAPEGATDEQILRFAKSQGLLDAQPQFTQEDVEMGPQIPQGGLPQAQQSMIGRVGEVGQQVMGLKKGIQDAALTMASGMLAEPVAGIAGVAQSINPFADQGAGAEAVDVMREALTIAPQSESGEMVLGAVGDVMAPVGEGFSFVENALGDFAFELTGSPLVAAAAKSAPTAILEVLGLRAIGGMKPGVKLLDDAGEPTKILRRELDKKGLVYENLSDAVKSQIPAKIERAILPPSTTKAKVAEKAVIDQIKAGATDDALAGLKVVGTKLAPDALGLEAIRQGFRPGTVQYVKTANRATKSEMRKMLNNKRRIMANERLEDSLRPSNIAGDSVMKRVKFISDKADAARLELEDIAKTKLSGKQIDVEPVLNKLSKSLSDLEVKVIDGPNGVPVPDFKGSIISKNKQAQKAIKETIELLAEGGAPDARRFHVIKRQLDDMIDFKKKGAKGLSKNAQDFLKDIRYQLNKSLRNSSPDYAKVNDVLSQSLGAFDDLQRSAGTSIRVFEKGGSEALGTRLRSLMSNQQNRINLSNSLENIDALAKKLGGKFDDNVGDLVRFSNALDDRFGATARTSFRGEQEAALRVSKAEVAADIAQKGYEKLRGVNDFNAFNAMDDILKGTK